jgi:ammonium transporter, Amt family
VTHISAAAASLTWMAIEWARYGKPSLVGIVTGTIAGLATITPASGFVGPLGGLVLGIAGGIVCFGFVQVVRQRLKIDDSLDVFAVHGVGGALGTLLAAVFAAESLGGVGHPQDLGMAGSFTVQVTGVVATALWAGIASFVILKLVGAMTGGLRVSQEDEVEGLDITTHGERGYEL